MRRKLWTTVLLVLLCAAQTACYLPSASRRAGRMIADGWNREERGALVAFTGPAMTVVAFGDFLVHFLIPLHYDGYFLTDRREPVHKWFKAYPGPQRSLEEVAVLCKTKRALHIASIQGPYDDQPKEARHEAWHFPECLEVLPAEYRLTVEYYARRHYDTNSHDSTFTTESTTPAVVDWVARAGTVYRMDALLGKVEPAPGTERPGSTIKRVPKSKHKLGTSEFLLDVGTWYVLIEPVESWDDLDAPVLEYRARWARYETLR